MVWAPDWRSNLLPGPPVLLLLPPALLPSLSETFLCVTLPHILIFVQVLLLLLVLDLGIVPICALEHTLVLAPNISLTPSLSPVLLPVTCTPPLTPSLLQQKDKKCEDSQSFQWASAGLQCGALPYVTDWQSYCYSHHHVQ